MQNTNGKRKKNLLSLSLLLQFTALFAIICRNHYLIVVSLVFVDCL